MLRDNWHSLRINNREAVAEEPFLSRSLGPYCPAVNVVRQRPECFLHPLPDLIPVGILFGAQCFFYYLQSIKKFGTDVEETPLGL